MKTICKICEKEYVVSTYNHIYCSKLCRDSARPAREHRPRGHANNYKYHLKSSYGITKEEWDALFKKQGKCCAICSSPVPKRKGVGWATDHCHRTGKVRGILCHTCNLHMGGYDRIVNNPEALKYATKNKS